MQENNSNIDEINISCNYSWQTTVNHDITLFKKTNVQLRTKNSIERKMLARLLLMSIESKNRMMSRVGQSKGIVIFIGFLLEWKRG